jgi:hypothetical protein
MAAHRWSGDRARRAGCALAAWGIIVYPALNSETQRDTYNREISHLIFSNMSNDDILVRGRPSGTGVAVQRRLHWNGAKPVIREMWRGDTLTISVDCPSSGLGRRCSVDYTVDVPAIVSVDADVSSGDITLEGMAGGAHLSTTSGDITARGLGGDLLDARAASGDLALDGLSVTALKATTISGDIDAMFGAAPHTVDATATSGDVTITVPRVTGSHSRSRSSAYTPSRRWSR